MGHSFAGSCIWLQDCASCQAAQVVIRAKKFYADTHPQGSSWPALFSKGFIITSGKGKRLWSVTLPCPTYGEHAPGLAATRRSERLQSTPPRALTPSPRALTPPPEPPTSAPFAEDINNFLDMDLFKDTDIVDGALQGLPSDFDMDTGDLPPPQLEDLDFGELGAPGSQEESDEALLDINDSDFEL